MASRSPDESRGVLEAAAARVGHALGRIARRVDAWKREREAITGDINKVITEARAMLQDVGQTPAPETIGSLAEIAHVTPARTRQGTPRKRKTPARRASGTKAAQPRRARDTRRGTK